MFGLNKPTHQAINLLFKPCKFDFSAFAPFAELVLPFFPSKLKQVAHQHESFWVRLQHELLNETLYRSLWQAQRLIAEWQTDYDEERPQTSLGGLTPIEFATRSSMDQNPDSLRL